MPWIARERGAVRQSVWHKREEPAVICERHKGKGLVARLLLPGAMRMACWTSGRTAPVEGGMAPRATCTSACYMLRARGRMVAIFLFAEK